MKKKHTDTTAEAPTAPALSEAEKRTRDFVAAAEVQITEERNQKGTPAPTSAPAPAPATAKPEPKPDYFARLMAAVPADRAALILAQLCRRKDHAIRQALRRRDDGGNADDMAQALVGAFKPREHAAA